MFVFVIDNAVWNRLNARLPPPDQLASITMDALSATETQNPSSTSSTYIESFAQIAALQAKGDHYGLIQAAEQVDLAVCLPLSHRAYCECLTLPPFSEGDT